MQLFIISYCLCNMFFYSSAFWLIFQMSQYVEIVLVHIVRVCSEYTFNLSKIHFKISSTKNIKVDPNFHLSLLSRLSFNWWNNWLNSTFPREEFILPTKKSRVRYFYSISFVLPVMEIDIKSMIDLRFQILKNFMLIIKD